MTIVRAGALALGFTLAMTVCGPAGAQTGMMNGSGNKTTTKARCSPGDPNVMLNVKTKTYTLDSSAPSAKSAKSQMANGMGAAADSGQNSTMKSICKSEAVSMGAKMAKSPAH